MRNMKVLMVNGSAHQKGNTFLSLEEVGKALKEEGIDYEIFQLGGGPHPGLHRMRPVQRKRLCVR